MNSQLYDLGKQDCLNQHLKHGDVVILKEHEELR